MDEQMLLFSGKTLNGREGEHHSEAIVWDSSWDVKFFVTAGLAWEESIPFSSQIYQKVLCTAKVNYFTRANFLLHRIFCQISRRVIAKGGVGEKETVRLTGKYESLL